MANILILTQFFPPETNAAANRIYIMTEKLASINNVHVITLNPSYPSPKLFENISLVGFDNNHSYTIKRTFNFNPHNHSLLFRALSEIWMTIRLGITGIYQKPEIVLVSSPSMFLGPIGCYLSRLLSARFVWDVRDVTWRYMNESVNSSYVGHFAATILESWMKSTIKRADLIIGATSGVSKALKDLGASEKKVITINNGVGIELLDALDAKNRDKTDHRPVVAYVGLVGYNQGLSVLLEVAKKLDDIEIVIAGDGPNFKDLEMLVKREKLTNVRLAGYLSRAEVIKIYNKADILFAQLKDTPTLNETGNPSKLFEYMATGKPIIYSGKGLAVDFLQKIGCAITTAPEDSEAIADAVLMLLHEPQKMEEMGKIGREFVENNYCRERLMDQLLYELNHRFCL